MKTLAAVRKAAYRFLASVFLYPDAPRRNQLRRVSRVFLAEPTFRQFAFFRAWVPLLEHLSNRSGRALEQAYVHVFDVTGAAGACSLCASAYLESGPGSLVMELRRRFLEAGFAPTGRLPADHLSVALEYLSALMGSEGEAWGTDGVRAREVVRRERQFLVGYLRPWVCDLCACMRRRDVVGVYMAAADALEEFVEHEVALTSVLEDPELARV